MVERRERAAPPKILGRTASNPAAASEEAVVRPKEKQLLRVMGAAIVIALLFPFPVVKFTIMVVLGFYLLSVFLKDLPLALCLMAVLIPGQTLVGKSLNIVPGVNYETLLMGLVFVAWLSQRSTFRPLRPSNPMPLFVGVVVAFLGVLLLAAVPSLFLGDPPPFELFQIYKNQWVYALLLWVVADSVRGERDRKRLMIAICIGMTLICLQPIYQATDNLAHGRSLLRHRAGSLLSLQPNIFGGALACFLPFPLMYFARKLDGKRGRILYGIVAGAAAYTLVLTLSRGSWLAMGAASLFIGILFERRVLLILLVVAGSAPFWAPEEAMDRADTVSVIDVDDPNLRMEEGSAFVRVDQWQMIPRVLADAPLLGHGFQRFPYVYWQFGTYGGFKGAHVGYAEYASEAGIPGLLLYVLIFITMGAFGLRLASSGTTLFARTHGIGLLGAAVAMVVAEGFGSRFKVGAVTAFLWMYAGVAIAAWRWPTQPEASSSDPQVERHGLIRRGARPQPRVPRPRSADARSPG